MKLSFCAVCGDTDVEYHHWIPRSLGGLDIEDNILTLCPKHHGEFHSVKRSSNHKSLIKKGLRKTKANGTKLGRPEGQMPEKIFLEKHSDIKKLLEEGVSIRKTAKLVGKSTHTVQKVKKLIRKKR